MKKIIGLLIALMFLVSSVQAIVLTPEQVGDQQLLQKAMEVNHFHAQQPPTVVDKFKLWYEDNRATYNLVLVFIGTAIVVFSRRYSARVEEQYHMLPGGHKLIRSH